MMPISELLLEAGLLMLVGMAVVFVFLTLLIFATKLLSKFAGQEELPQTLPAHPTSGEQAVPEHVVAAISAAVHQYKKNQK